MDMFEAWVEQNMEADFIKKQRQELLQLDDDLFVRQRI